MGLGGARLARHRQTPAHRTGRTGRGAAGGVLAQRVGQRVGESLGNHLFTRLRRDGHLATLPVEDLVDGARRAPHAARGQRRGDVGQFERIELERAEREGSDVLPLDVVREALVVVGVVRARGPGLGVRPQPQLDRHVHRARNTDLPNQVGERGVWRLCQRIGDAHRAAVTARVLHAPGLAAGTRGCCCCPGPCPRTSVGPRVER